MSADLPSSNPFRRKPPSAAPPPQSANPTISDSTPIPYAHIPIRSSSIVEPLSVPKKAGKKVRVQSPPPPSPPLPNSSPIAEERLAGVHTAPGKAIYDREDPFQNDASHTPDEDVVDKSRQIPPNPFSKTLATMEHSGREGLGISNIMSPGRASMDVDAFKRLLMTGSAGIETLISPPPMPAHVAHYAMGDGASSTDTSSISRQSIFEAPQEILVESPRTSHEISDREDENRGFVSESHFSTPSSRKKPPPPSSRHGRLIRIELRDDPPSNSPKMEVPSQAGSTPYRSGSSPIPSIPSQTDLNKPLPPAPIRRSHDSERESVFDTESAGKTPQPPSPSETSRKEKPRPPPPVTRRHSQLVADSKLSRSNSGRLSPNVEEDDKSRFESPNTGRPRSDSGRAPPPPPSRRAGSIRRTSSHLSPSPSASATSLPAPLPARRWSRNSSTGRPASISSLEIAANSKRLPVIPPPPPPRARNGLDVQLPENSQRHSGEHSRQTSETTLRRDSRASSLSTVNFVEDGPAGHDILADLSALQREIDALRVQSDG
jgi:hypothetical protein